MRLSMQRNKAPNKSCSVLQKALKSRRTGVCQSNDSYDFGPSLSNLAAASFASYLDSGCARVAS